MNIPYAEQMSAEFRFTAPRAKENPLTSEGEAYDATTQGFKCPIPSSSDDRNSYYDGNFVSVSKKVYTGGLTPFTEGLTLSH